MFIRRPPSVERFKLARAGQWWRDKPMFYDAELTYSDGDSGLTSTQICQAAHND
jgi:hypothetical protein